MSKAPLPRRTRVRRETALVGMLALLLLLPGPTLASAAWTNMEMLTLSKS